MKQDTTSTLLDLDPLCAKFAAASASLEQATADLEQDLAEVRDKHTARLKALSLEQATHEAAVRTWIESHPESFAKPRSHVLHGVEVGLQAVQGSVEFDDEESVVSALKRMYRDDPDTLATLVKTEESLRKDALRTLPPDRFTKAGCRISGAGDAVVVRRVNSDVEKLIKAATATIVKALLDQGARPKKGGKR